MHDLTKYQIGHIAGGIPVMATMATTDLDTDAQPPFVGSVSRQTGITGNFVTRALGALSEGIHLTQHPMLGAGFAALICAVEFLSHEGMPSLHHRPQWTVEEAQ
ncbi:hypothetical protein [Bordetella sp. 15P40C-2]|uniref:hypothetical protein n=1 Tax=Bordetella sp. 15P40C-2 TaxID=2572246 RepID=UPI001320B117|nr:hypothetical protein [Bordetella sp. 15P40C-2]MVW70999.1 hypothetical protein [Bordetella sp. 15P40C-2]